MFVQILMYFAKFVGNLKYIIHLVTHELSHVREWCKQYTGGEFWCNSVTQTLPLQLSFYSTESCLFTPYRKKVGFCSYMHCYWLSVIFNIVTSSQARRNKCYICYCLLLPPKRYEMCVNKGPYNTVLNFFKQNFLVSFSLL